VMRAVWCLLAFAYPFILITMAASVWPIPQ
jgi:hypothetical protein